MKITFANNDSIYKILKNIEKLNPNKHYRIYIDEKNSFFDSIWWGQLLQETIQAKNLDCEFVCKTAKAKRYFDQLGLNSTISKGSFWLRVWRWIYNFFFKAKDIHRGLWQEKSYISYIVIGLEIVAVFYVFYFFYGLVSPSANISIKPVYSLEEVVYSFRYYPDWKTDMYKDADFISMSYHTGHVVFDHTLNIGVENIKYLQKPSKGKVTIYNENDVDYSLVANTKFITQDGLLFKSPKWFKIPAANNGIPGKTTLELEAMETDIDDNIIGDRGNIGSGELLYIKNLSESFYAKKIYARANGDFRGGESNKSGLVTQQDINVLTGKLYEYVQNNKKMIISQFNTDINIVVLPYEEFFTLDNQNIQINANPGDDKTQIQGIISGNIEFLYVDWEEIKNSVKKFLEDRSAQNMDLIDIDRNSLIFFDKREIESNVYALTTQVNIVWGYNFAKDINGLKEEIKSRILGKNIGEAQEIILDYPEIDLAIIKVSPSWYDVIPSLKSRIDIEVR